MVSAHLALNVDGLGPIYKEFKAKGVRFKGEPIEIPAGPNNGNLMVYMLDPDDFTLQMIQIRGDRFFHCFEWNLRMESKAP